MRSGSPHATFDGDAGMRIGLLLDRPLGDPLSPVINQFAGELSKRNCDIVCLLPSVDFIDLGGLAADCDFYVSKACTDALLALTGILHDRGAHIFNSFAASCYVRDKARVTAALMAAGIPVPNSCIAGNAMRARAGLGAASVIFKPIRGTKGQGIQIAERDEDLRGIDGGPHFAQTYDTIGDDDIKVYVIGDEVFTVRRQPPVGAVQKLDGQCCPCSVEIRDIARSISRLFDLDVCGIDIVETSRGLAVVDVNSFPRFVGVPYAAERLADCILARASRRLASRGRPRAQRMSESVAAFL